MAKTSGYWVVALSRYGHGKGYGKFKKKSTAYRKANKLRKAGKRNIYVQEL